MLAMRSAGSFCYGSISDKGPNYALVRASF
jgi:hypothetical protein